MHPWARAGGYAVRVTGAIVVRPTYLEYQDWQDDYESLVNGLREAGLDAQLARNAFGAEWNQPRFRRRSDLHLRARRSDPRDVHHPEAALAAVHLLGPPALGASEPSAACRSRNRCWTHATQSERGRCGTVSCRCPTERKRVAGQRAPVGQQLRGERVLLNYSTVAPRGESGHRLVTAPIWRSAGKARGRARRGGESGSATASALLLRASRRS